jgi:hypothetical protein
VGGWARWTIAGLADHEGAVERRLQRSCSWHTGSKVAVVRRWQQQYHGQ